MDGTVDDPNMVFLLPYLEGRFRPVWEKFEGKLPAGFGQYGKERVNLAVCSNSTFFTRFTQIQLYVYLLVVCLNYMTFSHNSCFNFTHSLLENHRQKCTDTSTLKATSK